jgi:hypothetical protein
MKRLALVGAVLAALAAIAHSPAHAEDRKVMPEQFRGTWCKATDAYATNPKIMSFYPIQAGDKCDTSTIKIGPQQYSEATWTCDVTDVDHRRAEFRYVVSMRCNVDPTKPMPLRFSFSLEHGELYVHDEAAK